MTQRQHRIPAWHVHLQGPGQFDRRSRRHGIRLDRALTDQNFGSPTARPNLYAQNYFAEDTVASHLDVEH